MARKRFNYMSEKLSKDLSHNSQSPIDPSVDRAGELYRRVGDRFKVVWQSGAKAEPIIYTDTIPDGVSEDDVRQALVDMKSDGVI